MIGKIKLHKGEWEKKLTFYSKDCKQYKDVVQLFK